MNSAKESATMVLVRDEEEETFEIGLVSLMSGTGITCTRVQPDTPDHESDWLVPGESTRATVGLYCQRTFQRIESRPSRSERTLVILGDHNLSVIRGLVRRGAAGVVLRSMPGPTIIAAVTAAASGLLVVPEESGTGLADRVEEPQRVLSADEERFLSWMAVTSIERAGLQVGLSRRQAERRFRNLQTEFGIMNHVHGAYLAGRWGLIPPGPVPSL